MKKVGQKLELCFVHLSHIEKGKVAFPGVKKKIESQIKCFNDKGFEIHEIEIEVRDKNKLVKRLPGFSGFYDWKNALMQINKPDVVYLRHVYLDSGYIDFLRSLKTINSRIKIIIELPTYPYDKERFPNKGIRTLLDYPLYAKDHYNRGQLKKYVDRIVTYTEDEEIFGIPTIRIQNGLDVSMIPIATPYQDHREEIHIIAVASLQPYHGYERIFSGLQNYYEKGGSRKVVFHIVGSGEIETELKNSVKQAGIDQYVIFYGSKTGDELTEIFNQADIGIGSFGFYKIGLERASSLKTREYLARGLPVVSGCRQDIFEIAPCEYHFEFPNDSSPVDIQKIIRFYDGLYSGKSKTNVFHKIRAYAEDNVTMEKSFAPVIHYLMEDLAMK